MSAEFDIARAARAARRDNAFDCVVAALTISGLPYEGSRYAAEEAVEAMAAWLRERGQGEAADLLLEFTPS